MSRAVVLAATFVLLGSSLLPAAATGQADAADSVSISTAYRFDAEGLLSLSDADALPVPRGAVEAHWFDFDGWAAVLLEGLDARSAASLCIGTSVIDPSSGLLTQISFDPVSPGACDDAGAGELPAAGPDTGIRTCGGSVAYVTRIPAELGGALVVSIVSFAGDGTGVGVSGRLEAPVLTRELDPGFVDCGPVPPPRDPNVGRSAPEPTPAPTPAPDGTGWLPAAERAPAPVPNSRASCPEVGTGGLQDVYRSAAGPYLMQAPGTLEVAAPTVVFLPGGGGDYVAAQRAWETVFAGGAGFEAFLVVIPYAVDGDFPAEALRTFEIVDELLWCFGADPMQVHLAGAADGGLTAFGLMIEQPERFATLAGLPGAFPVADPSSVDPAIWADRLAGRAVLNGIGAFDLEWRPTVIATHNALAAAGVESLFLQFPGQGQVLSGRFHPGALVEFWSSHP